MKHTLLFIFNFIILGFVAQTTTTTIASGSGNYSVPCGVSTLTVQLWGAGGGGANGNGSLGGSGGGGGGYTTFTMAVASGNNVSYTVGAGGTAGNAGGNTTFNGISANGGGGGVTAGAAGAGGSASGGTSTTGSAGSAFATTNGGAGGAGAGPGGGTGGSAGIGAAGGTGNAPGGGGGGGAQKNPAGYPGGTGGAGQITIKYTTPPTISAGSNQTLGNCVTTANMAAPALPANWSGYWVCASNCAGVSIATPTSLTSGITGLSPGYTTVFNWVTTFTTGCATTQTMSITSTLGTPCSTVVPTNDACASAIPITAGTQVSGTTLNSTTDIYSGIGVGAGSCTHNGNVWYSFTTGNAPLPCYTFQEQWNTSGCNTMILTTGCSASAIGSNLSNNIYNDYSSTENTTTLTPNTTYYVSLGSGSQGPYTFALSTATQAANDQCTGAQGIGTTPNQTDNAAAGCEYTYIASQDANVAPATLCAGSLENISWFTFTAINAGTVTITLSNILCNNGGGGFQTGLITGSCSTYTVGTSGAAVCIAAGSGTVIYTINNAIAGQTYLIGMDGNAGSNCHFAISGTNITPLPIKLSSFNARLNGNSVDISWTTDSEKNNDFFTIERSADGTNFDAIGTVKGAGTTTQRRDYYFQDKAPLVGTSYYRLKQTDFDKTVTYSAIHSMSIKDNTNFDFVLYPKPSFENEEMRLQFHGRENDIMQVFITDISGKLLSEKEFKLNSTFMEVELKHNFRPGIYFIKVLNNNGEFINQKFVVQ